MKLWWVNSFEENYHRFKVHCTFWNEEQQQYYNINLSSYFCNEIFLIKSLRIKEYPLRCTKLKFVSFWIIIYYKLSEILEELDTIK